MFLVSFQAAFSNRHMLKFIIVCHIIEKVFTDLGYHPQALVLSSVVNLKQLSSDNSVNVVLPNSDIFTISTLQGYKKGHLHIEVIDIIPDVTLCFRMTHFSALFFKV